jgi:DNA recombination protein RmuC
MTSLFNSQLWNNTMSLNNLELFIISALCMQVIIVFAIAFKLYRKPMLNQEQYSQGQQEIIQKLQTIQYELQQNLQQHQYALGEKISHGQVETHKIITESIQGHMKDLRDQINHSFKQHAEGLTSHLRSLNEEVRNHLQSLSTQVNHKLTEGFEKTSTTFTSVIRRLTIIDEAQKKINELSTHVVSLQDVLLDKRARGAFGEVQLSNLISNMIPPNHYEMQYTLSNQKRADCILFLPDPTGNVVIDAKFPLETYQRLLATEISANEKRSLQQQFRQDIQKHIKDIAEKYIIPGETSDGAIMFIPAESVFAEIHANYPELIALSQKHKVWLTSPSTLMAILTTARSVLKDDATRKQIHIIQKHLQALSSDFQRFEKRMDKLSRHIHQAHQDVDEVNTSARKITQRFQKIESVELDKKDLLVSDESD